MIPPVVMYVLGALLAAGRAPEAAAPPPRWAAEALVARMA